MVQLPGINIDVLEVGDAKRQVIYDRSDANGTVVKGKY